MPVAPRYSIHAVGMALTVVLAACGDVVEPPHRVATVRVSPTTVELLPGATTTVVAEVRNARGDLVPDREIVWTTAHPDIATVTAAGLVRAVRPGETSVRASADGRSASALVRVSDVQADLPYELVYDGWSGTPGVGPRLYRLDVHGPSAAPRPVDVPNATTARDPAPSPDGRFIAFAGEVGWRRGIWVAASDGSGLRQLTSGEHDDQPAWSPDGTRIAFRRWPAAGGADIWIVSASGDAPPVNLTAAHGSSGEHAPAWAPTTGDSARIAYSRVTYGRAHIYVMRSDGSAPRPVTAGAVFDDSPSWSPDGAHIAFQRHADGSDGKLWVVTAGGDGARMLMPHGGPAGAQFFPAWSPDGRYIAFTWRPPGGTSQVYTVRSDGTEVERRTSDGLYKEHPTWIWR